MITRISAGLSRATALALVAVAITLVSGPTATHADEIGTVITTPSTGRSPVLSPSGAILYMAHIDSDEVSIVDLTSQLLVGTVATPEPVALALSPDGASLYVASFDGQISVIDTSTGAISSFVNTGRPISKIALGSGGSTLWVAPRLDNGIISFDIDTATRMDFPAPSSQAEDIDVSADGTRLYVTYLLIDSLVVFDAASGAVAGSVAVGSAPYDVELLPDGSRAYVANYGDETVSVIDTASLTVVATIPVPSSVTRLAAHPDGSRMYVSGSGITLVLETATNVVTASLSTPGIGPIVISPDGTNAYRPRSFSTELAVIALDTQPVLSAETLPAAHRGEPYSFAITATGTPTPTFSVTSGALPAGLVLDGTTGVISGSPTSSGITTFTVTASSTVSGIAAADDETYTIEVTATLAATGSDGTSTLFIWAVIALALGITAAATSRRFAA